MSGAGADGWLLGIEVGGTKLQLGIGRADGSLAALERLSVNPTRGAKGILDQIEAAIGTLLHRMMLSPHDVRAIGVGFGGPVDVERYVIGTRTAEGRSRAKAHGQHMGRPPKLTPQQQKEARRRRAQGATLKEMAKSYNVGKSTISRLSRDATA